MTVGTPRFGWTSKVPSRELTTVGGEGIRARRYEEIVRAGIIEIAVFHSPGNELRGHELPLALVVDPARAADDQWSVDELLDGAGGTNHAAQ